MSDTFKYFAFISSSSRDICWGKRLHSRLEHYRMSSALCSQHGWKRTPMRPVFFAPTDIQPGELSEELKSRLRASRNLIVICSPNSAQSGWVSEEIKYFHELGRTKHIHFFIVKGQAHSHNPATECINPIVDKLGIPEILGANIHEKNHILPYLNKERAYVQLISKLLGIEFDDIWQRHKRRLVRKITAWIIGFATMVFALSAVKNTYQPFDMEVKLKEVTFHNEQLPSLQRIVISLMIDEELRQDTLTSLSECAIFKYLPHRLLKKETRISVTTLDTKMQKAFCDLDTCLCLAETIELPLHRDTTIYGHVFFSISGTKGTSVSATIEGTLLSPNPDGLYCINIPLEKQRPSYNITASVPLSCDTVYMPCFEGLVFKVVGQQ